MGFVPVYHMLESGRNHSIFALDEALPVNSYLNNKKTNASDKLTCVFVETVSAQILVDCWAAITSSSNMFAVMCT